MNTRELILKEFEFYHGKQDEDSRTLYLEKCCNTNLIYASKSLNNEMKLQVYCNIVSSGDWRKFHVSCSKSGIVIRSKVTLEFKPYHYFLPPNFEKVSSDTVIYHLYLLDKFCQLVGLKKSEKVTMKELDHFIIFIILDEEKPELENLWTQFQQGKLVEIKRQVFDFGHARQVFSKIPWNMRHRVSFESGQIILEHYSPQLIQVDELEDYQLLDCQFESVLAQAAFVRQNPLAVFDSQGKCLSLTNHEIQKVTLNLAEVEIFTQQRVQEMTEEEQAGCIEIQGHVFSLIHLTRFLSEKQENPMTREKLVINDKIETGCYFFGFENNQVDLFIDKKNNLILKTPPGETILLTDVDEDMSELITYLWSNNKMLAEQVKFPHDPLSYLNPFCINFFARNFVDLDHSKIYQELYHLYQICN